MLDPYKIIKKPIITEKTTALREEGKYVFEVHPNATKPQIKQAVQKLFNVKVEYVNTLRYKGKPKRVGRFSGYTPRSKRAIVKLKEGESIKFFEAL